MCVIIACWFKCFWYWLVKKWLAQHYRHIVTCYSIEYHEFSRSCSHTSSYSNLHNFLSFLKHHHFRLNPFLYTNRRFLLLCNRITSKFDLDQVWSWKKNISCQINYAFLCWKRVVDRSDKCFHLVARCRYQLFSYSYL